MKKVIVFVALVALMIGSLSKVGVSLNANGFKDLDSSLPALPAE